MSLRVKIEKKIIEISGIITMVALIGTAGALERDIINFGSATIRCIIFSAILYALCKAYQRICEENGIKQIER